MVRLSGFVVLVLTCVCAPRMASACWESSACSDLSSKDRMLVRDQDFFTDLGGGGATHKHTQVHTGEDVQLVFTSISKFSWKEIKQRRKIAIDLNQRNKS